MSLGFACNNRCLVCAQGELRRTRPAEDAAEARRQVEWTEAGDTVLFQGGEPTLAPSLLELLARARARGAAHVVVQTNGRRVAYPAYADALAAAGPRLAVDVSLLGSTAAMHDYHTRAAGSFAQTAQGIRNAAARGVRTGVTVVMTRSNYRHLPEIVRLARHLGADAVHFAPLELVGSAERLKRSLAPQTELLGPHLARAVAEGAALGLETLVGAPSGALADRFAGTGPTETVGFSAPVPPAA